MICLVVVCSAVDIKIVSYGTDQGPEPCARVCYGTTAGTLVTSSTCFVFFFLFHFSFSVLNFSVLNFSFKFLFLFYFSFSVFNF